MECGCVFSTLNGVLFNSKQQKQKKNWWILNSFAIIKTWKTQQQRNRTQIQHGRKQEHQSWTMLFVLVLIFIVDVVFGLFFFTVNKFFDERCFIKAKHSVRVEWIVEKNFSSMISKLSCVETYTRILICTAHTLTDTHSGERRNFPHKIRKFSINH